MSKPHDSTKRLLVKICRMYYFDNMTQNEIAKKIGVSRSKISRCLSQARQENVVRIYIDDEYSVEQQYEKKLCETYGIKDACVVSGVTENKTQIEENMGAALTSILQSILKDGDTVGVMAGYAVNCATDRMGTILRKDVKIAPMIGGMGVIGAPFQVNQAVVNLSEKLQSPYYILNSPVSVETVKARDILMNEPDIKLVLDICRKSKIAIVGIGEMDDNATLIQTKVLNDKDVKELKEKGGVASLGTAFLNDQGECIDIEFAKRMIGLSVEDIRKIPYTIGISYGPQKVRAIQAALRSGLIDVLITDMQTAGEIVGEEA